MRGAQGYFLKNFKKVRKSQVAGIKKIVVVGVSAMFRRRVELLHGQRVFRCRLPHARRHVVLVVARVSAVAVRRARGVISVTAVLMAAVLLGLGVCLCQHWSVLILLTVSRGDTVPLLRSQGGVLSGSRRPLAWASR